MVGRMRPIQRREALGMLATGAFGRRLVADSLLRPARDAVDHIVIGAADLERGIATLERRIGVRPAIGGSHPGRGTRNALFSLGGRQYAELIAPDPAQAGTTDAYGLSGFGEPRMLMWAASTMNIEALAARLKAVPNAGSRVRPDGRTLRWRTVSVAEPGLVPFFIQWDEQSLHPSEDSPHGCTLAALAFEDPDPAAATRTLAEVGIAAHVDRGAVPRIKATLETPRGSVAL